MKCQMDMALEHMKQEFFTQLTIRNTSALMAVVNKLKVSGFAFGTIRPNSDVIDEHVFDDTNIVLAPFNVSGDHWELLAFYPSVRHIVYVNPLFADLLLAGKDLMTENTVNNLRRQQAQRLLDNMDRACDSCHWLYHATCAGSRSGGYFRCDLCQLQGDGDSDDSSN
ncbi:hypothetical protein NP493_346g02030 [Ridgeia piscesae]|uniref:Ubiquitin-like protease family profile domain-containing protein n=1 Tax=Ridgeia piscesae TaxID=27915 RepID=A0AAD9L3W1_RIDPI|nr:hypothetical protein NP493_346g02030 [Ridgeia piscesae]